MPKIYLRLPQMRMIKVQKNREKNLAVVGVEPRISDSLTTTLPTTPPRPPWVSSIKLTYITNKQKLFFELEKKSIKKICR